MKPLRKHSASAFTLRSAGIVLVLLLFSFQVSAQFVVPFKLKSGKWKLIDRVSKNLSTEEYQEIIPTRDQVLLLKRNNKWGAVNAKGKNILPVEYDQLIYLKNGILSATKNEITQLFRSDGTLLSDLHLEEATCYRYDSTWMIVKNKEGNCGVMDVNGKIIHSLDWSYPPVHFQNNDMLIVKTHNDKPVFGVSDKNFHPLIGCEYKFISFLHPAYFVAEQYSGKYDLYDLTGKKLWSGNKEVLQVYPQYLILSENDREVLHVLSTGSEFNCEHVMRVYGNNGPAVCAGLRNDFIITSAGKKIVFGDSVRIAVRQESQKYFALFTVGEDDSENQYTRMGLADLSGKIVIPVKYRQMPDWTDEYVVVGDYFPDANKKYRQKQGVISLATGKMIVPMEYEYAYVFNSGMYALKTEEGFFLYDKSGKKINNQPYYTIQKNTPELFSPNGRPVHLVKRTTGKSTAGYWIQLSGVIDDEGKILVPPDYYKISPIQHRLKDTRICKGYAVFYPNESGTSTGKCGFMDCNFKLLTPVVYTNIMYYFEPYVLVSKEDLSNGRRVFVGVLDTTGKTVLEPVYDEILKVLKTGIIARKGDVVALLNSKGQELIPFQFRRLDYFNDNYFKFLSTSYFGLCDRNGNVVLKGSYKEISQETYLGGTIFKVKNDKEYFYADLEGNEFLE